MNETFNYLLVLPVSQMNHIRTISKYKGTSCAAIIREAIQNRIITFEVDEKPIFDQIKKSQSDNTFHDEFFTSNPWENSY
jgi:hypothetical protein